MSGEKKEESDEDDPEIKMDPTYFKTINEIKKKLDEQEKNISKEKTISFKNSAVMLMYDNNRYYHLQCYQNYVIWYYLLPNSEIIYPITLPEKYKLMTLRTGTKIYRKAREDEQEKRGEPRFYAEKISYPFDTVATARTDSGAKVYTYVVKENIKIVNFDKRWRSQIWHVRSDLDPTYYNTVNSINNLTKEYESILQHVCESAGAVGWRAACFGDQKKERQQNKIFLSDNTEFEIALFDSNYVQRVEDDVDETKEDAVKLRF
jgi:hypothetical protein